MAANIHMIFLILIVNCKNVLFEAKRLPSKAVDRKNPCPDICRIKEDNPHCREVSARNLQQQLTNVSVGDICEKYLTQEFARVDDCVVRCNKCTPKVMHGRCSMSLKKVTKLYARCKLPSDPGACKGEFQMWNYDYKQGDCTKFVYSGCGGNDNKFNTSRECFGACGLLGVLYPHPESKELLQTHQEL